MSFGIHALDIRVIVLPLSPPTGLLARIGSRHATDDKARSGTNACTLLTADGGTGNCTDHRSDRCACNRRFLRALLRRSTTILL